MTRIAVIGCGAVFEAFYLESLKSLAKEGLLEVALLVDSNEQFARSYLRDFPQAKIASQLSEGLSATRPDRALVLTPPASHASIMETLANAGIHVYSEKPLTVQPSEAAHVNELFASKRLLCKVGFVRRVFPNFRLFKECFGQLGADRTLTITDGEVFRWPIKTAGIFTPAEAGGGVVWDKLSHNLDLIQWIDGLASIDSVVSNCRTGRVPTDILVEGRTKHGRFKVAVSWTEGLPNMVRGSDGQRTIESKNGLVNSIRSASSSFNVPQVPFEVGSYGDAVRASLVEFLKLKSPEEPSILATAAESVALTEFLAYIDQQARGSKQ